MNNLVDNVDDAVRCGDSALTTFASLIVTPDMAFTLTIPP